MAADHEILLGKCSTDRHAGSGCGDDGEIAGHGSAKGSHYRLSIKPRQPLPPRLPAMLIHLDTQMKTNIICILSIFTFPSSHAHPQMLPRCPAGCRAFAF